ncbi:hypothetical protein GGR56DRAFT_590544 [Xylariaceae sp. FL0804]|nr:hypothetical protein GGR56DRAFT_590544 [Xylariaceae sp. FL0804]
MTSTTTTAAATSASAAGCGALLYEIPVTAAACAVPFGGNRTAVMASCCGASVDVVAYQDDCGLYCLATDGQDVGGLQDCLFEQAVPRPSVFCNVDNRTASATATDSAATAVPTGVQASIVVTGSGSGSGTGGSDATATSSGGGASSSSAEGAAPRNKAPEYGLSRIGLTVGALLFTATAFGAFQL